jgi:hypothetical protein
MAKKPSKKSVAYWWREAYGEVRSRHVLLEAENDSLQNRLRAERERANALHARWEVCAEAYTGALVRIAELEAEVARQREHAENRPRCNCADCVAHDAAEAAR